MKRIKNLIILEESDMQELFKGKVLSLNFGIELKLSPNLLKMLEALEMEKGA